jgi:hypothetical protein
VTVSCAKDKKLHAVDHGQQSTTTFARQPEAGQISDSRYLSHIAFLAHDQLEGRGTGSRGIDLAAGYIAGQFAALGLTPGGDSGTYFQNFTIPHDKKISSLTRLTVKNRPAGLQLKTDFMPLGSTSEGSFEGELVFAGYGLSVPDMNYDDYADLEVKDKIVVAFRGQPPRLSGDGQPRERAYFDRKIERASELGAVAVLFVNVAPAADTGDLLISFGRRGRSAALPALHITRAVADELLAAANEPSLTALQEAIDCGNRTPTSLTGVAVSGHVELEGEDWPSRNVIGVLPGNGPQADQVVVLGAHYDHLGIREGKIYNGADDNASGSAGVIEACGAIAQVSVRNRTLLCMTFTGEEIGLLGSKHYVQHPTVPIDSIVTMINMDMIGRWTPGIEANELGIQGLGTGDSFARITQNRTDRAGIKFLPDTSAKGPSDHASFYEADVPSLFFFTGVHSDYHRPGDDAEKINAAGGAEIASLVAQVTLDLINADSPPRFQEVEQAARIFRGPKPSSVVMGIMPDQDAESNGPGWPIALVVPGGGADKGGMKAGDRILSVDGQSITGISEYYKAIEKKNPGDVVPVSIRRDKEELTLQVELAARP